ncbi:MAG: peptidoglycan LD-endopeptidase LytH [Solirubrobacteraceae bacterium]|nr:peptidoglycan LD-endopeptidase LytH [Solirubrobacteraceae bacterium]
MSARNLILAGIAASVLAQAPAAGAATATPATGGAAPSSTATGGSSATQAPTTTTTTTAVGSTTQLARDALALGSRTLRMGATGKQVKVLQRVLTAVGYRVRVTGYFGALTRAQVRRFQKNWTLPVVGYVGPGTAKALRDALAGRRPPARNAQPVPPAVSVNGWTFPIRGAHSYGDAADRYGAPRDGHTHAGQDILATCGLPEVAARGGKVIDTGYGGSAGYYVAVHTTDTQYDYFYAHLRSASTVKAGQTVATGQLVGYVGETGDAVGCHLHFELWDGAWWNGGHTIDPLPFLKAWDK